MAHISLPDFTPATPLFTYMLLLKTYRLSTSQNENKSNQLPSLKHQILQWLTGLFPSAQLTKNWTTQLGPTQNVVLVIAFW
jgi:hypothetical protein